MPSYFFEGNHLHKIKAGQKFALFLDFDGTLVPIQKDPAKCFLSEKVKEQLRLITRSKYCYLSILSGRSLSDIRKRVGIRTIYYGGNHGLDISGPGVRYTHPKALKAESIIKGVKQQLKKEIKGIGGAWLEDKKFTLSLHFRSVKKEGIPFVKNIFDKTVAEFLEKKSLAEIKGKKVLELVPEVSWDKGTAVLWILQRLKDNSLSIYIGDDQTDETAFKALSKRGITIRIGSSKRTFADYYLKGHWEVSQLLKQIQKVTNN
ncbi:MAG: hypothetical protein RBG1_1C00001G0656 [candidate division Zixibacteria bacterium RBG-1]|nr:MAG: hypothetical protein RBG1_1C00001G0656 [candidate division Zixibacteria bacterium RBG-1]OGC85894.1 MAG: trehalose-phosphatase [candidate division Zixibacteria bacterium RBG_19FT_COMBO_42_43]